MSHVKRQFQLMILKLNYKLLLSLKGRELDVHIVMHGRNPIYGANYIQQEVRTMFVVYIALSLSTSKLVVMNLKSII